jgi:hypothetical protein
MVLELREKFFSLLPPLNFQQVTAYLLFLLVLGLRLSATNYLLARTKSFGLRSCGSLYCISFARSDSAGISGNSLGSNIINRCIFAGFGSVVGSPSLVAANLRGN